MKDKLQSALDFVKENHAFFISAASLATVLVVTQYYAKLDYINITDKMLEMMKDGGGFTYNTKGVEVMLFRTDVDHSTTL